MNTNQNPNLAEENTLNISFDFLNEITEDFPYSIGDEVFLPYLKKPNLIRISDAFRQGKRITSKDFSTYTFTKKSIGLLKKYVIHNDCNSFNFIEIYTSSGIYNVLPSDVSSFFSNDQKARLDELASFYSDYNFYKLLGKIKTRSEKLAWREKWLVNSSCKLFLRSNNGISEKILTNIVSVKKDDDLYLITTKDSKSNVRKKYLAIDISAAIRD